MAIRITVLLLVLPAIHGCSLMVTQPASGDAQVKSRGIADAKFMEQFAATRRFTAGRPTSTTITPDSKAVLFLRSGPRSFVQDLFELDLETRTEKRILTAEQVLQGAEENLSTEEKARRERMRMSARGIASYKLSKDGSQILVPLSGRLFVIARATLAVTELESDQGYPIDPKFSPDGEYVSCVRDGELFVIDLTTHEERQLTNGAGSGITHALAEFVAQEEMGRRSGYWWSPDSSLIAFQRTDTSKVEKLHILDAMHPEKPAQAWPYPRAGRNNADVTLGVISLADGSIQWIDWDREQYPYLATVRWQKNAPLTILVQNRRQTEEALLAVDAETGSTSMLLVEEDSAWINLDQSMPHWITGGSRFLWTTERNGAWQLEMRLRDGSLERALTDKRFPFTQFVDFDPESGIAYVLGSDDPRQTHLYRVDTKSASAPVCVTTAPGAHHAQFSKDHSLFVHSANLLNGRRTMTVRHADGSVIAQLESLGEDAPFTPNLEFTTVGTHPALDAVLIRPRDFDPAQRYPVIVYVYGGPHSQVVRKTPYLYLRQQWFADHGFVVVAIDGQGTPSRGRAWERATKGNLIEIPLADQIAGLKALGSKYRELDLSRVGIYGWSFGGYFSAMAVTRHPEIYRAAIAAAPVTDWRDYDTHYTERYMGLPEENLEGYKRASVLTHAESLSRPLLLIHGTADDNVYFMHSLKLSNELFRAGIGHEFLPLSDFTHMVADPEVTARLYDRMADFFIKNLKR